MAYGSTLTDLQSGINSAAQIDATAQAALRDYYARLADIRARRAMASEDVGQRDRALVANTGVQSRGQDVTQLLGLGQIDATKANALAEIAQRDRALGSQGDQFAKELAARAVHDAAVNENALNMFRLQQGALSPKGQEAAQLEKGMLDEWNASATAIASQANQQLESALSKHKAASVNPAALWSPSTWMNPRQTTIDTKLEADIDAIRSGLGPHADKIIWDGTKFQPAIRDGTGRPVTPLPPTPQPAPPMPTPTPAAQVFTPLPASTQAPRTTTSAISSMGGSFGGGPSPLAPAAQPAPAASRGSDVTVPFRMRMDQAAAEIADVVTNLGRTPTPAELAAITTAARRKYGLTQFSK